MKISSFTLLLIFFFSTVYADSPVKYSRVRITIPDQEALTRVFKAGLDAEGVNGSIGGPMEFIANSYDLTSLTKAGIHYTTTIADLEKENQKGLVRRPYNALGFGYGSMGGYYTYAEVVAQLDSMHALYPQYITARESIGAGIEGRALWAVKISDNPNTNEPNEPEVLYTGLHHAREPEGMMAVIYYMWWLLEHHDTDPEAAYLIDNRQMYFVPVVNPDGYVYNQTSVPGGGGMFRKNRKHNPDGTYGIDLNRNYGPTDMWDSPLGGSDAAPAYGSDTYRGTAAFSEPETKAIEFFAIDHQFKTALNYHTYGNYLIFPWGAAGVETEDSVAFREFASDMTGYNRYRCGLTMQTVRYLVRGTSDDFLYSADTKPKVYAMTPEVGLTGFWPSTGEIYPLAIENLKPNMYIAYVAGQYTGVNDYSVSDANHDGSLTPGEDFSLDLTLRNKGLDIATGLTASVTSEAGTINWNIATAPVSDIGPQSNGSVSLTGSVSGSLLHPSMTHVYVTLTGTDGYVHHDTLVIYLGQQWTAFADSASGTTAQWNTGTGWGLTSYAHTAPASFTDSPAGNYSPSTNNALTLLSPIDLRPAVLAQLSFWSYWVIEPLTDFGVVEVSSDSGATWENIKTEVSHRSSGQASQNGVPWGYDAFTPGGTWLHQTADLSSYAGMKILLRFRLKADGADNREGWYVDDITVNALSDSITVATISVALANKWNILSLPVKANGVGLTTAFPGAIGSAYGFTPGAGYAPSSSLSSGYGYWAKFPNASTAKITGTVLKADTIALLAGWNLIGSVSGTVDAGVLTTDPPGIITSDLFGFNNGYFKASALVPGKGYWINSSAPGVLYLSVPPMTKPSTRQ